MNKKYVTLYADTIMGGTVVMGDGTRVPIEQAAHEWQWRFELASLLGVKDSQFRDLFHGGFVERDKGVPVQLVGIVFKWWLCAHATVESALAYLQLLQS